MLCNRWNIIYIERSILWEATWCGMLYYFSIFFKWVFKTIGQMYKLKAKFVNKTNWMGIMFPWVYGIKWIVNEKLGFICATISY
jgi:hypothetical protein